MRTPFRHRRPLLAGLALAGAAVLATGGTGVAAAGAGTRAASPENEIGFDFDKGNAIPDVLYGRVGEAIKRYVSPKGNDATLVFRIAALTSVAQFDAIAPYRATPVGIYSSLGRRPASESVTNRNKNIAILYASYRVYNSLIPDAKADWRKMLTDVGLDPDDDSEDLTSPVGIGNRAGNAVVAARIHDGMNQLGDANGQKYNRQPYSDSLGFEPVNTAYELRDPSRWQPGIVTNGNGLFKVQQFVTPQLKVTTPFTYENPAKYVLPPPVNSDYKRNRRGYRRQAKEVLAASAALTDETKVRAEFFDDKFRGIGLSNALILRNAGVGIDAFVDHITAGDIAAFDTLIASWYNKVKYQAVRPFTAVHFLYGNRKVTAWGGPGKGTVRDLRGRHWQSYLETPDHTEYPSASTAVCTAMAQAGRRAFGTDKIELSYTWAKGSSNVEPGVTPSKPVTLNWTTWTDWVRDCGNSRVNGGVHFKSAVEVSWRFAPRFGDMAYEFVRAHVSGRDVSGG